MIPKEKAPARPAPNGSVLRNEELRASYRELAGRLLERRDEIIGRRDQARANLDEQIMGAPGDTADESVLDTSADYFLKLANTHQVELLEIRDAFERMHRGVYGICASCENPIAIERLRRLPYARYCVDCQSQNERRMPRGVPKGL